MTCRMKRRKETYVPIKLALNLMVEKRADGTNIVGSSLDHLIGTWTQAEADEMGAVLNDFETIETIGTITWTSLETS